MSTRGRSTALESDPLWYKDAIIYHLHVKAFQDSNDDGVGDFPGLTTRLDYIQDLGVNTIWLLPFYPSPMRDDGYDIADYRNIYAPYGTRRDFSQFVREAHRRGIRVITELVINHTSDQNRWFQAARRAPRGSVRRDFYVWSDSDKKYDGTRIIFTDTETSNWAWDPLAEQYYWHRFFSHQPDLNFANPAVVRAVSRVMRFWLDMGVDGLRLDAIPYLCEREGTNNENLPETHAIVRQMRAVVDAHYRDRMFLAEANQWPEDVRDYFGDGDECHMAYHFPLMPRMYMAIAQEDRHPIVEIFAQTPSIPENCQWAIFLRNHDELTLEMVTDEERDYLYQAYAKDPRMRINVGIRRRLAPLLDNDMDRIKLMKSLLMSMPGSPIIYYGDEIGMGDNVFLGDRNSVRTPMQWSPDRNAGFSRADPQQLYLPPIMDPVYGFQSVNVEAQSREVGSLLNWTRRLIAVRKSTRVFGRGRLTFLRPGNRRVLAYLREYEDQTVLCVANMARTAQPVALDLARYAGRVPVEMMGRTAFPPVGEAPYLLTLPGHGFYWFRLATEAEAPSWHLPYEVRQVMPMLALFDGWRSLDPDQVPEPRRPTAELMRQRLLSEAMPDFLGSRRWFAAKGETLKQVALPHYVDWAYRGRERLLCWLEVSAGDRPPQTYFVPLSAVWGEDRDERVRRLLPAGVARIRQQARVGLLVDAVQDESFAADLVDAIHAQLRVDAPGGRLLFTSTSALPELLGRLEADAGERPPPTEGSNSGLIIGNALFLKVYRRLQAGLNPELEMGRFLTEHTGYRNIARVAGALEFEADDGQRTTLAMAQEYLPTQGDAWRHFRNYLSRFLEQSRVRPEAELGAELGSEHALNLTMLETLGRRTGELHVALMQPVKDPAFEPEPVTAADVDAWRRRVADDLARALAQLQARLEGLPGPVRETAAELLARRGPLAAVISKPMPASGGLKIRHHGDYHLGQVLVARNDFILVDFEGEPSRTMEERRRKESPLRDVAGMLRSLHYVACLVSRDMSAAQAGESALFERLAADWHRRARDAFLQGYVAASGDRGLYAPLPESRPLLDLFILEKALYELRYELDNRPDWVGLPVAGLLDLLRDADDRPGTG